MSKSADLESVLVGRQLSRIRRVLYEFDGAFRSDRGPLELTVVDAGIILLQPASDGELLAVQEGEWTDPFTPPLSPENEEFVRTHGRWSALDVSNTRPYDAILRTKVEYVRSMLNLGGAIVGMEVHFQLAVLRAKVEADELLVDVSLMDLWRS